MSKNIIIIGAGAAGRSAASSVKKANPSANIFLIGKEENIFIRCSAPYAISGENKLEDLIKPWKKLIDLGINLIKEEVVKIDSKKKEVVTKGGKKFSHSSLVLATGAEPIKLPVPGINLKNVFTLRTSKDTEAILKAAKSAKRAVIIGGGAIGIEAAEALQKRNLGVSIVEMKSHLMGGVLDGEFCQILEKELVTHKIDILTSQKVEEIIGKHNVTAVKVRGKEISADLVLMAVGVKSNTKLAEGIGLEVSRAGIKANQFMQTSDSDIFAAGDCAACCSDLFGQEVPTRLAPRAVLEGKIAGKNAAGKNLAIGPYFGCFSMKVYDLGIASLGLTEAAAKNRNIKTIIGRSKSLTKHDSFKKAKPIEVKLVFDENKLLLGGTIIGEEEIAGRIDLLSLAIEKKCTAFDLVKLDYTSYPKFTPLPNANPIVMAAEKVV